jgi:hypothetical protein
MSFWDVTALRTILDTETDADSPGSEELMSQVRENIESIILLLFNVASGTATSDPPNDTTGWFIDTAAGFADDEHNGRTLLITSGTAKGNFYTIDDTEAANNRVECAGDNLYSDGVRSGDSYIILYDLTNSAGHDHNGTNSKAIVAEDHTIILADWTADGNGGTDLVTTSTTYVDIYNTFFLMPQGGISKIAMSVYFRASTGAGDARVQLQIDDNGSLESSEGQENAGSWTWFHSTAVDVSGLTPGSIYELAVRLKEANSAVEAQLRYILIYNEN